MQLAQLAAALPEAAFCGSNDLLARDCAGIAYDSRQVQPGFLFAAIPGARFDGHDYIAAALQQGAAAIICERLPAELPPQTLFLRVADSRLALAQAAAAFYGHPDRELRLIGITGTNGKTTTTYLLKWLLEQAGHQVGLIGTIQNLAGAEVLPASHTTPESLELMQLLRRMVASGCDTVVMEVSSHALDQGRVSSCEFDGAVFTNLTQDHLDYHGDFGHYLASKTRLFSSLNPLTGRGKYAIIKLDDAAAADFAAASKVAVVGYGQAAAADLRLLVYQAGADGMRFQTVIQQRQVELQIPLCGKFNIYNSLAALAAALCEGVSLDQATAALANAPQIAGRFERVDAGQDFLVVVDYAHTPDGLENLLQTARELQPHRLISVFGCGGDRDRGKRPLMGRIAAQLSDLTVITSDNPRFEDPAAIIAEIEPAVREVTAHYLVAENRRQAIALALQAAATGDIVVIAGKGHEDYQLVQGQTLHFDDREVVRELLRAKLCGEEIC